MRAADEDSAARATALLEALAQSGRASFLAVLKRFGAEGKGLLSFPMAGYTLALDMPLGDPEVFGFLEQLDEIVLAHGGRIYLAKNPRVGVETFRRMYPRYAEWLKIKRGSMRVIAGAPIYRVS
jgi:hypothetical protein